MAYLDQLVSVPEDSTLYKVYARDQPVELGGSETYIGDLVLEGGLVKSKWADEKLFFRHQKMDDDLKEHQDWDQYEEKYKKWKCPFFNS